MSHAQLPRPGALPERDRLLLGQLGVDLGRVQAGYNPCICRNSAAFRREYRRQPTGARFLGHRCEIVEHRNDTYL